MKVRLICCAVAAAMLLCGCQTGRESQNIPEDPPAVEQPEQESPPSDDNVEEEEKEEESPFPPAPPVCELDFTETESFPLPFEDELLVIGGELYLSTEQALYDYDTMWQLLEENYPFFEAIKRELGIDWEEVKADYRQVLEGHASYGYIGQAYFLQTIDGCLREFQSVGHLFLVTVQSRVNLLDLFKNSESAHTQNKFELVSNPKSELSYRYFNKHIQQLPPWGYDGSNSDSEEGERVNIDKLNPISQHLFTGYVGEGIPYLRIASFSQWDDAAQARLEDFFSNISQKEHLIIDVRGNGGGDTGGWMLGIVPFLAQAQKKYEYIQLWAAKSGSLNLILEPEFDKSRGYITRYTDDSWQEEFPYISPDMVTGMDIFLKVPMMVFTGADVPDRFHGKIWVLVDKNCYSATEALVCFCKETGFATLVGTNTGGSGKGAAPYYMALPYSGLIVAYETYLSFNLDGTCNGTSGTVPDIVSEEGRGALETCLMAINGEVCL